MFGTGSVLVDVAKELVDGFGPLKAVLEIISAGYTNQKVRTVTSRSRSFSDESICRNLSPSEIRLKTSFHA